MPTQAEYACFLLSQRSDVYHYYLNNSNLRDYADIAADWWATVHAGALAGDPSSKSDEAVSGGYATLTDYMKALGCISGEAVAIIVPPNTSPGAGGNAPGAIQQPISTPLPTGQWQAFTRWAESNSLLLGAGALILFLVLYKPGTLGFGEN